MSSPRIVGISGNVRAPSRTSSIVKDVLHRIENVFAAEVRYIDLADKAPVLFRALRSDQLDEDGIAVVKSIEDADVLVVGTPVYRASYTGALKHLFDLAHFESLINKPVILAATGGSPQHGLVIDHQLRPLFGFFKSLTLPGGIYALETDFSSYALNNPNVSQRIDEIVLSLGRVPLANGQYLEPKNQHSEIAASAA